MAKLIEYGPPAVYFDPLDRETVKHGILVARFAAAFDPPAEARETTLLDGERPKGVVCIFLTATRGTSEPMTQSWAYASIRELVANQEKLALLAQRRVEDMKRNLEDYYETQDAKEEGENPMTTKQAITMALLILCAGCFWGAVAVILEISLPTSLLVGGGLGLGISAIFTYED